MSIDRVSTASQTAYHAAARSRAPAPRWTRPRRRSPAAKNATTYAGFGNQAQVLTATMSASARNSAYTTATTLATTQVDLQDTQLTSLSDLAAQLQKAVSDAVANNDGTTLMTQAQSIFDQATAILNSKDANGDYIYGGGKTDIAPVTVTSLSAAGRRCRRSSSAFANGNMKKSVQVADGQYCHLWRDRLGRRHRADAGAARTSPISMPAAPAIFSRHQPDPGAEHLPDRRRSPASPPWPPTSTPPAPPNGYVSNRLTDATDPADVDWTRSTRASSPTSRTPTWPTPPPSCR